ncbi:hypothetical protein ABH926_001638 [Catenulispora sp. GP43]|uniref:hypothetical protein n=1 Tax=Catenulispora sp. GP43 TaxID=3156263 RepID=UPI003511CD1A
MTGATPQRRWSRSNNWTAKGPDSMAGPAVQHGPWDETPLALLLTWPDIKGLP